MENKTNTTIGAAIAVASIFYMNYGMGRAALGDAELKAQQHFSSADQLQLISKDLLEAREALDTARYHDGKTGTFIIALAEKASGLGSLEGIANEQLIRALHRIEQEKKIVGQEPSYSQYLSYLEKNIRILSGRILHNTGSTTSYIPEKEELRDLVASNKGYMDRNDAHLISIRNNIDADYVRSGLGFLDMALGFALMCATLKRKH